MGREPRAQQRPVALAGIDVNFPVDVFTISVDDAFTIESSVSLKPEVRLVVCSCTSNSGTISV
jgi:hypothetical protein